MNKHKIKAGFFVLMLVFFLGGYYFLSNNTAKVPDVVKTDEKPELSNKPVTMLLINSTGSIEGFDDLSGFENHLYYIDLRGRAINDIVQEAAINPRFSLLRDCSEMIK